MAKILWVTPEITPFVKVGGLADVAGALPKALARAGHEVRCVCPLYGSIERDNQFMPHKEPLVVKLGYGEAYARIWEAELISHPRVPVYFIEYNDHFARPEVYSGPWGEHQDNDYRFSFFSRAALDLCYWMFWMPDVVHCHDWATGLVPVMLNTQEIHQPLGRAASVLTIHNLAHQGYGRREILNYSGLPQSVFRADSVEACGKVNMLKGGIYHATKVTTVSPTYALEIQSESGGFGLQEVLRFRAADLIGVTNGIDLDEWNSASDPHLIAPFEQGQWQGKAANKAWLQAHFHMLPDPELPVFAVVARLYEQKGLDLLAAAADALLQSREAQLVILGTGENWLQDTFLQQAARHAGYMGVHIGFDNALAHRIYAGSDFFIMPSRFEPCGLGQLYAMQYGSIPIARATGGLKDTIHHGSTGFLFPDASRDSLLEALESGKKLYREQPRTYFQMREHAMAQDFSWMRSAHDYENIYRWAREVRSAAFA